VIVYREEERGQREKRKEERDKVGGRFGVRMWSYRENLGKRR
jgi:hypothetical protein